MPNYESLPDGPERETDMLAFGAMTSQVDWHREFGQTYEKLAFQVCKYIDTHSHWLRAGGGFVYMTSHHDDTSYKVLLTDRVDLAGKNRSAIIINQTRWPEPHEPSFPNGEVLSLTDIIVSGDKIGLAYETQYKDNPTTGWTTPDTTTLLYSNDGKLNGYGNLRRKKGRSPRLHPINYKYLDSDLLLMSNDALEDALHALKLLHENDIEQQFSGFSN